MFACQILMIFISITKASFEFEYLGKPVRKFYFVITFVTQIMFIQLLWTLQNVFTRLQAWIRLQFRRWMVWTKFIWTNIDFWWVFHPNIFNNPWFFVPKDLGMRKRSSLSTFFIKNKFKRKHGHLNDDLQMAEYSWNIKMISNKINCTSLLQWNQYFFKF